MEYTGNLEGVEFYKEAYRKANIRYGDLKKQLAEDMNLFLKPIRDKILDLESDDKYLGKVVKEGAEKAHISADNTLNELKEIIGFKKFYPVN
jgi:tryptophanyl-tRNA synthetase